MKLTNQISDTRSELEPSSIERIVSMGVPHITKFAYAVYVQA